MSVSLLVEGKRKSTTHKKEAKKKKNANINSVYVFEVSCKFAKLHDIDDIICFVKCKPI